MRVATSFSDYQRAMTTMTKIFDFDKSVSEAHYAAAEWDMDAHHHGNPFNYHNIYIHDFRSGHIRVFTVTREDFTQTHAPEKLDATMLAGLIVHLIDQIVEGKLSASEDGAVGPALVGYIKKTQTYRTWCNNADANTRLHAILNIYPEDNGGKVRPFIVKSDETVLSAKEMIDLSNQVASSDRTNGLYQA